jgi:hypothetical protein
MASKQHDFIVSAIARKMKLYGFRIIFFDGNYQDVETKRPDIPPKIINHKPDIIGEKNSMVFCIGEAKTKDDIHSERTKNQIIDFFTLVKQKPGNILILGVPLTAKEDLGSLLMKLGLGNQKQIEIIHIPEELLPHEEDISF